MKKSPAGHMRRMEIEFHRGKGNEVTGATVHHHMMPAKASKSGAFMEETHHGFPFSADQHGEMMDHIEEHTGKQMGAEMASAGHGEPDGDEG